MSRVHEVRRGDCVASIAAANGFRDVDAVWGHSDNADLRARRRNPNILAPGDCVAVPERRLKKEAVPTGQARKFRVTRPTVELVIRLLDDRNAALAGKKYVLKSGTTCIEGTTDPEGHLKTPIPIDWLTAELAIWEENPEGHGDSPPSDRFVLEIGSLAPADILEGAQARLANLGFWCGAADGQLGPRTRHALLAFQASQGLATTGALDEATIAKLEEAHGC